MKPLTKISFICFLLITVLELRIAFSFLTASQITDYHQIAMGASWDTYSIGMRTMTLNFLRAAGLGFLLTGISFLFILFFPFRRGEQWSRWALISICTTQSLIMGWIVISVRSNTPAQPPFIPFVVSGCLAIFGFFLYRGAEEAA